MLLICFPEEDNNYMYGIFFAKIRFISANKTIFLEKEFFRDACGAQTTGLVAIIGRERPISSTTGGDGSNLRL